MKPSTGDAVMAGAQKPIIPARSRPRRTRMHKVAVPTAQPECEIVPIYFEVDDRVVSVIDGKLNRIAIFPSEQIGGLPAQHAAIGRRPIEPTSLVDRLREAIIVEMSDMEPEDNGVC